MLNTEDQLSSGLVSAAPCRCGKVAASTGAPSRSQCGAVTTYLHYTPAALRVVIASFFDPLDEHSNLGAKQKQPTSAFVLKRGVEGGVIAYLFNEMKF